MDDKNKNTKNVHQNNFCESVITIVRRLRKNSQANFLSNTYPQTPDTHTFNWIFYTHFVYRNGKRYDSIVNKRYHRHFIAVIISVSNMAKIQSAIKLLTE